jgi:uncharacterized protein YdaU (DUF1376 family)
MNHYPRHIGDWMVATAHLSEVEECIYSRMLDVYYSREKPLPLNEEQVARLVRAASQEAKKAVGVVLREFFTAEATGWHQKRCDAEIRHYQDKCAKAAESAGIRWSGRNPKADANAMRTHSEGNANQNQEPLTKKKPIEHAPSPEHRDLARQVGADCDYEWQKYLDWLSMNGKRHASKAAGFRNWLRKSSEFKQQRASTPASGRSAAATAIFGDVNGKRPDDAIDGTAERVA